VFLAERPPSAIVGQRLFQVRQQRIEDPPAGPFRELPGGGVSGLAGGVVGRAQGGR
jgi:hypothetical protein